MRWEAPVAGWVILNTDGAAKGNPGPAGAGGVIRGDKGEWIVGFSENLGHCSSVKAEICAILRGLSIARETHVQKLWLQTDLRICSMGCHNGIQRIGTCFNNVGHYLIGRAGSPKFPIVLERLIMWWIF